MKNFPESLLTLFQNEPSKSVLIYGDFILDKYVIGHTTRISPEAPVPILSDTKVETKLGGAANVFKSFQALDVQTVGATVLGTDKTGMTITSEVGAGLMAVFQKFKITPLKTRYISQGQQILRHDEETIFPISDVEKTFLINYFCQVFESDKVLVISDYGKGSCEPSFIKDLIYCANKKNCEVYVDPHNGDLYQDIEKYVGITGIKCNLKQAIQIVGKNLSLDGLSTHIMKLLKCDVVILTLSEKGLFVKTNDISEHITNTVEDVYDTTGAGDATLVGYVYGRLLQLNEKNSAELANAAGNIKVQHHGTYQPTKSDFLNFFKQKKKIISRDEIPYLQLKDKTIVFSNGCFDLLHPGHIAMLEWAKSQGDVLIVGVNSDTSIKRLKGETRPILNEEQRSYMVSQLQVVDYVVVFEENSPLELISEIKPDIHVKGSDHTGKTEGVNRTLFFPRIKNISTTELIETISEPLPE
jgi:D-beta-D-heptose 7-phosphate kinase/D-beta-D-heptose 1-phosphate adenosyltransferase